MEMSVVEPLFELVGCASQPRLSERPLLDAERAGELSEVFGLLANDTRLRMVHALAREGELNVTDLARAIGMSAQAVSNQLRRLVDRGIVAWRREGASVRYRIVDPCVVSLLDLAWCVSVSGVPSEEQP
jgi:ArsR family transcriptional regulator, lead/cadmium/zinc/bismuth-responsive transcriptional repressor